MGRPRLRPVSGPLCTRGRCLPERVHRDVDRARNPLQLDSPRAPLLVEHADDDWGHPRDGLHLCRERGALALGERDELVARGRGEVEAHEDGGVGDDVGEPQHLVGGLRRLEQVDE